jgi:hypothetical protein
VLPHADHVPWRVAERGYPKVAFRIRRRNNLAAVSNDLVERFVDTLDKDVRSHAGLAGNRQVRHEVADDVPGAILEARVVGIAAQAPAEYSLLEGR